MHACGAAVRSRVHGNSRGTRVRGVEQGVRLFSLFPRFHSVLRARLTIEAPFFVIVFFPYFCFLQSAYVASSVHGHASLLQARASERSNRLGKLSSNTHQNTTNERIITNPLPLALVRSPQNIALLLLARERLTKHISDVV
jgi:hypothetical protein